MMRCRIGQSRGDLCYDLRMIRFGVEYDQLFARVEYCRMPFLPGIGSWIFDWNLVCDRAARVLLVSAHSTVFLLFEISCCRLWNREDIDCLQFG